jgi:phenylpropionate dioxygenase-like ring-hydroxylating dioxygenase large terminal subunit
VQRQDFWYIVSESSDLNTGQVLSRKVLGEWLAVFRGPDGKAVALQDRCPHRNARLSKGRVESGALRCPYHGWLFDSAGTVAEVPSEGAAFKVSKDRCALSFECLEQEGYVYVRLRSSDPAAQEIRPFAMPNYGEPGFAHVRLLNRFKNNVINCAENFIDIPHTVFVHPGIFRKSRAQKIEAIAKRSAGRVDVEYFGETDNLGWFAWFLNPGGETIRHTDSFIMPNVTSVEYIFGPKRRLSITSQSVPCEDDDSLVYTDLTYNFGPWTRFAGPILAWQGQKVIDQDVVALGEQMEVIKKYGEKFSNTRADAIHVLVESIRDEIEAGRDPRALPEREARFEFWV